MKTYELQFMARIYRLIEFHVHKVAAIRTTPNSTEHNFLANADNVVSRSPAITGCCAPYKSRESPFIHFRCLRIVTQNVVGRHVNEEPSKPDSDETELLRYLGLYCISKPMLVPSVLPSKSAWVLVGFGADLWGEAAKTCMMPRQNNN